MTSPGVAKQDEIQTMEFKGPRGGLHIKALHIEGNILSNHLELHGSVTTPAEVIDSTIGVTLYAQTIVCNLSRAEDRTVSITGATLTGNSRVIYNSAAIEKDPKDKTNPKNGNRENGTLTSDQIQYDRKADESILTIPTPLDFTSESFGIENKKVETPKTAEKTEVPKAEITIPVPYHDITHLTGSQGKITVAQTTDPKNPILPHIGDIEGPVVFDITRTETPPAPSPSVAVPVPAPSVEVSHMHGVADHFHYDFVAPPDPTLTLTGHVKIDADAKAYIAAAAGTEMIVNLDRATRKLKSYRFGKPGVTTVKPAGGGN